MDSGARRFRSIALLLAFATGAVSLAFVSMSAQMVHSVVGEGPFAVVALLGVSMLGLGLGAEVCAGLAGPRYRPIILYGWLEICIGLCAFGFSPTSACVSTVCAWFYRAVEPAPVSLAGASLCMSLAVLPAMLFIGGTLPALGRLISDHNADGGRAVACLYGVTILGAAVGYFVSVFLLLPAVGVRTSLVLAGCSAVCLGAFAIWRGPAIAPPKNNLLTQSHRRNSHATYAQTLNGATLGLALTALGVACFCSLACAALLRSLLVYTVTPSLYSSAMIMIIFLGGIAVGICLSARLIVPRPRSAILRLGLSLMLVSLGIVASVWLLSLLPRLERVLALMAWRSGWCLPPTRFAETFAVMFLPALLMGAALAIAITVCLRGGTAEGRRIAHVQAVGTVGALLGWLVAAFVLLPVLGTFAVNHELGKLLWMKAGPGGTVAVNEMAAGERVLVVDGVELYGSGLSLRATQMLQSYIPLCLHRDPKRILQIGVLPVQTARMEPQFPVQAGTIIQPAGVVFDTGKDLQSVNGGSIFDGEIRKVVPNGQCHVRLSDETFDIIINDVVSLSLPGRSRLLTVEHFMNCRRRLRAGGLLSCRIPLDLPPSELCMILAGFRDIFPHASVWLASNCVNSHCVLLGSLSPLRIDFRHTSALLRREGISKDLAEIAIHDVYDLLDCHVCDGDAVAAILQYAGNNVRKRPLRHTDNLPLLELSAASRTHSEVHKKQSLSILATHHRPVTPYVTNFADGEYDRAEIARRFEATRHILSAHICELSGLPFHRKKALEAALMVNPAESAVSSYETELQHQIQALQNAVAAMPHKDALAERLADKLFIALRYPEATAIYTRLIEKKYPPSPNTFVNLAGIRFSDGNLAEAEGLLRRCLDRWPDSAEAHDRLGGIYFKMGRLNASRYHAGQALLIEPTNTLYLQHYDHATRDPNQYRVD